MPMLCLQLVPLPKSGQESVNVGLKTLYLDIKVKVSHLKCQ